MWTHLYAAICWLVGTDQPMPDRERIMAEDQPEPQIRTIEAATVERCDGCGAQSKVVWERDSRQLWLCEHHSRANATGLHGRGWTSRRVVVPA